jgi:hypothetical protein
MQHFVSQNGLQLIVIIGLLFLKKDDLKMIVFRAVFELIWHLAGWHPRVDTTTPSCYKKPMVRVVIITGSTGGIGCATAAEFLKNGDRGCCFLQFRNQQVVGSSPIPGFMKSRVRRYS